MRANGDGEGYDRISLYYSGVRHRITNHNAVVEPDEECVRVTAKAISACARMRGKYGSDNLTVFREWPFFKDGDAETKQ